MSEQEDFSAVSRQQAILTLLSTVSFETMPPEEQRSIHERLSDAYLKALSKQRKIDPEQAIQSLQDDGLAPEFMNQLSFRKLANDLIKNLFDGNVRSSIKGMATYSELMKACTAPLSTFVNAIGDSAASDYLDSLLLAEEKESDKPQAERIYKKTELKAAKLVLAAEQRGMLRQVILIGIARILVDRRMTKSHIFLGLSAKRDAFNLHLRDKIIDALLASKPSRKIDESSGGFGLAHDTQVATATLGELSGAIWVARFPGSNSIETLEADFKNNVKRFLAALKAASAGIIVTSTLRPPERAYLMHWSWKIVRGLATGEEVPPLAGVNIIWWHGNIADSKRGAQEMVNGYGIGHLKVAPAIASRHTQRRAIDMKISWSGNLRIRRADGLLEMITSTPKNGANRDLIRVGSTYKVFHLQPPEADIPHWSTDGR